jgi:hypothetical protein
LSSSLIENVDDDKCGPKITPIDLSQVPEPGPRKWVWERRIPDRAPTVFYGDGGLAKSYIGQLLANHIARGTPLFGGAVMPGRVLYVDFELDLEEQTRRAYFVARGVGLSVPPPGIYYLQPDQPLTEIISQLSGFVRAEGVVLVIVDSFGLAVAGDPIAARDVIPVLRGLNSLPCASLVIDHSRNPQLGETAAGLSPFGSVYKRHLSRSVLQVIRAGGDEAALSVLIRPTKANFSALADPLALRVIFSDDRVSFEQADASGGEFADAAQCLSAQERVLQALTRVEHASPKELAKLTGLDEGTVRNQLTYLRKQDKAAPISRGRWQAVKPSSSSSLPLSDNDDDNAAGGQ